MDQKVKICHITSAHTRYDTRILMKECVSLQKGGYSVYLVVNDEKKNEIYEDIKIYSTKKIYKSRIKRMCLGVWNVYKMAKNIDADIYHLHDPELLLIALFFKKRNKKVIFDSHEAYYLQIKEKYYLPKILRGIISKFYRNLEKFIVRRIDAVIIPVTIEGENIFENIAKETVFINNLPKLERIDSYISEDKKDPRGICYIGALSKERGITNLIKASYKANATLYLAGNFSSEQYQYEVEHLKEYCNVRYLGYLNKEEVYALYKRVNIGMCVLLDVGQYSKADNLSTKVYEYMMGGLPVILSNFSYNKKIIEKYQFGVTVNPNSINDIAEKINMLLLNKKECIIMGENGKNAILNKFNWGIEEKKLLSLYEELSLKIEEKI